MTARWAMYSLQTLSTFTITLEAIVSKIISTAQPSGLTSYLLTRVKSDQCYFTLLAFLLILTVETLLLRFLEA